jgi:succinate dehydrogenase/fumarate reductase-like Fe-S protein
MLNNQSSNVFKINNERSFIEDFKLDNGCYENICSTCGKRFHGHKRRVTCKKCIKTNREK